MKAIPKTLLLLGLTSKASALTIVVDYTFDTNGFFASSESQAAIQAVADRYSRIITTNLLAVSPNSSTSRDWRIGFQHPGTGDNYEISTAASAASDGLVSLGASAADEYGFGGLQADQWILYAGGRSQSAIASGGSGTGTNFTGTFDDISGPLHRGIDDNTPGAGSQNDLPRWGGASSFDSDQNWHFDIDSVAPQGTVDFYSIALHEVGHALGLNTTWNQWETDGAGLFLGQNTLDTFNAENGTNLTGLALASDTNPHFADNVFTSEIFELADPNLIGTVGLGEQQDLLMDPVFDLSEPGLSRQELTNVDVAALVDVGWTIIPEPSTALLVGVGGLLLARRRRSC